MSWIYLLIAGALEIAWATALKYTEGFSRIWPTAGMITAMCLSVLFLGLSLKTLPMGTAYAVWTGIGSVGVAILGIILFNEPSNPLRLACIALVILGIAGLKLTAPQ